MPASRRSPTRTGGAWSTSFAGGPIVPGMLAQAARISFPGHRRHLKTLRRSGLVEEDRDEDDSRVRIPSLEAQAMGELKTWLAQTDALWAR